MNYKIDTSQTMVSFEEQGRFLKNQLRSLVPLWRTGFYIWTLKIFICIFLVYIWIFFEDVVSLWVSLRHEKAYLWMFLFTVNRKNIHSFEKVRDFQNNPQFKKSKFFYDTITGDFKRFYYFSSEVIFCKKWNPYVEKWVNVF